MAKTPNVAEFSLSYKENKYKGNVYPQLVGSFKKGTQSFLITMSCDSDGNIKVYNSKDGTPFVYARAIAFNDNGQKPKRKNEM